MRFFQRLAPGTRTQHAVQPVLPPRFGVQGPDLPDGGMPPQVVRAPTTPATPAAPDEPAVAPPAARAAAGETAAGAPHAPPGAPGAPASAVAVQAHGARDLPASRPAPSPGKYATPFARAAYTYQASAVPARSAAPGPGASTVAPASPAWHTRTRGGDAPVPPPPLQPLSALALAQRMQGPKNDTTVVHVTIDRIDVRTPAPTQAPRAQARPRPAPTTSLADYLRRGRS